MPYHWATCQLSLDWFRGPHTPLLFLTQCLWVHPLSALLSHLNPSILRQLEILSLKAAMSSKIILIHLSFPVGEAKCPHGTALTRGVLLGRCTQRDRIDVHDLTQKGCCWAMICRMATEQSWFFFLKKQFSAFWNLKEHHNSLSFTWPWTFFFLINLKFWRVTEVSYPLIWPFKS